MDLAKILGMTESSPGLALVAWADEANAVRGGDGDVVGSVLAVHWITNSILIIWIRAHVMQVRSI